MAMSPLLSMKQTNTWPLLAKGVERQRQHAALRHRFPWVRRAPAPLFFVSVASYAPGQLDDIGRRESGGDPGRSGLRAPTLARAEDGAVGRPRDAETAAVLGGGASIVAGRPWLHRSGVATGSALTTKSPVP
jgi:hypothetical protein